jgi:PAS domain S-box-containing protein
MRTDQAPRNLPFLDVPGELAAMIRQRDWTGTAIGPPESWPQSLRTVLQLMLTSRYAMWMAWGPELTFFCNDAYRPTLGVKEGWLGASATKVWEEIWPEIGPRIDHVLATGEATWDEALLLFLERSGFAEESYHTFSYSPLANDAGTITGMLCVVTEVTGRVIDERRLHVLRELSIQLASCRTADDVWAGVRRCLAQPSPDLPLVGGYTYDDDGSARRVLATGTDQDDRIGAAAWPLDELRARGSELLVDDRSGYSSLAWKRPCAKTLIVPIAGVQQTNVAGAFVAGLNPFRPLDADYRSFINLFVGQIAAALAAANAFEAERQRAEALAKIDRAKTAFFSNVSHEFRTPLTLMLGPLEDALVDPSIDAEQRQRLSLAHSNSQRLLRLVNSLLDFSRIESDRLEATYRPTDLAALTSDLASTFRSATDRAGLALTVDAPSLDEHVHLDREMWEKIVFNLLSNAFKFTFTGEIAVRVSRAGKRARVTVRDTGTGIPESELARVFERFHRVEGAQGRSFEGSGIGLALVQELVRQHQGTIGVQSTLGEGTTFTVEIPFGTEHLPPERVLAASTAEHRSVRGRAFVDEALSWLSTDTPPIAPETTPITTASVPHRIVLADDNVDMRSYIARILHEHGYDVQAVADGLEALSEIRAHRPALLITDVMMPGLDGFGLLEAIRGDSSLRDLPVVMLSARAGEESRVEGLAAGADDYLVKPFSARELVARVDATATLARIRRQAAEAIRETEVRTAGVLRGMNEGYVLIDERQQVLEANDAAFSIAMVGPEQAQAAIGRSFFDTWRWLGVDPWRQLLTSAFSERRQVVLDDIRAELSGDRWIEVRAYPVDAGLAIFLRDISDRKTVERELQELNETLEQQVTERTAERDRTWNNAQDMLLVMGVDGVFQSVNPAWTTLLGYRAAELVGHHMLEFVHPDDHAETLEAAALASRSELPHFENRYRHKDGSYRWISWTAAHEGDLVYGSGRNVTAERESAAELERAQDQLRQSQKMEAVGQLTGGLAHDFNNLLAGITGSLELLQIRVMKGQTGELDRYINAAQGAARRAAALTHRLLAFSRRQTLDPKPTDVNRLIADLEDLVRRTVGLSVEIEVVGAAGLWTALVDQNQLESAILNLCINARDAMPDGGRITIETANKWLDERAAVERDLAPGQYLSICVTDNGTGMTAEVRERAFEPFFTTKPLGAGTGLGLSMVYGFARQSGGQVRIYSELGQGTTICLYLPRHLGSDAAESAATEANARVPDDATERGRTVLVVDDEPTVRMLVAEVVDGLGCKSLEAQDGANALRILQSGARVDLLVTDVGLPGGMNGRQVADAARALRPGLRVLFITGYAENAVIGNGHLAHGMQVLTKPFPIDVLSQRIRELLADLPLAPGPSR